MKPYFKAFLVTGISTALFVGIFCYVVFGLYLGLGLALGGVIQLAVGFGVVFGVMPVAALTVHIMAIRRLRPSTAVETYRLHQLRELDIDKPPAEAIGLCRDALNKLNFRAIFVHRPTDLITAKSRISWKTIGESITIQVTEIAPESSKLEISSRPITRVIAFDYGKNFQTVEDIVSAIRHLAVS